MAWPEECSAGDENVFQFFTRVMTTATLPGHKFVSMYLERAAAP